MDLKSSSRMVIKIVFLAHRKEGEKGQLKTPKVNTAAEAPCYTPMTQANSRGAAYDKQIRTYLCVLTWGFTADSESGQNVWNTGFLKHLDTVIFLKIACNLSCTISFSKSPGLPKAAAFYFSFQCHCFLPPGASLMLPCMSSSFS